MKRLALAGLLIVIVGGVTLGSSCFAPTYSDCAFRCASEEPKCPAEYACQADGYCHLPDSTAICAIPRPPDLAAVNPPDLTPVSAPDLAEAADASSVPDGS